MTNNLELDDTGRAYVNDLANKRAARKAAQEAEDRSKARLVEYLGDATTASLDGQIIVERISVTTNRFDSTRFKKENADTYSAYLKESISERVNIAEGV